jgi:hypothetical protein
MIAARVLVQQIAVAGGHIWLKGEHVRITAAGPLPNGIVEGLRKHKAAVVEVLRLLPACCECGAKIPDCVTAWWGGQPVHVDCGEAAWRREWKGEVPPADASATEQ